MKFLHTNLPPLRTKCQTFADKFIELAERSDKVRIATGYITADSLVDLQQLVKINQRPMVDLVIGMHYFDGFTEKEYVAAKNFSTYLQSKKMGCIYVSTAFKYHGKIYSFVKNDVPLHGIIGSNNLGSIGEYRRIYESSLLLEESNAISELDGFISDLVSCSKPFQNCEIDKFKENDNQLLNDIDGVSKVNVSEFANIKMTSTKFRIPLKADTQHEKSNLNVFFGKGRVDSRGFEKPRHWYEVELIVPKQITEQPEYPGNNSPKVFDVVTDDLWRFKCKVSGDYNKNFRSEHDLKILGKWIKGRLENAGVLNVGSLVTNQMLRNYGKDYFELTKTETPNLWFLNFAKKD